MKGLFKFMGEIQSNKETAQSYANQITTACQTLSNSGDVTLDTTTELEGNTRNHSAINQSATFLKQITSSIETASSHLQTIASNFEAVDTAGAKGFGSQQ